MVKGSKGGATYISFFIVILLTVLLCWIFSHRILMNEDLGNDKFVHDKSVKHIKNLLDETNRLLNDIKLSNITLNRNALHDISELNKDTGYIKSDIMKISHELEQCESRLDLLKAQHLHDIKLSSQQVTTQIIQADIKNKWLVIGIPTVARKHDEDYLLKSLKTLISQLPTDPSDLFYQQILVVLVNMQVNADQQKNHSIFYQAKDLYGPSSNNPLSVYFEFLELKTEEILPDPKIGSNPKNDVGNANKPGFIVRRQTRNIVSVMRKSIGKGKHYLFLEDDMEFCPNGLLAIQYLLSKSSRYHPDWLAIRASYGMNGIFLHEKDMKVFADYLLQHQLRRPPDHLVVEWYAGETKESKAYKGQRVNIGFKYNLFNHIGRISTLRATPSSSFPKCYDPLGEPTVFKVEAFNARQCPKDDIWPCNVPNAERIKTRFNMG